MPGTAKTATGVPRWRTAAVIPYVWLTAFFLVPFLIVLKISLSETVIAQPPYLPVLDLAAGWEGLRRFLAGLSFDNYAALGSDRLYLAAYLKSLEVAAFSTLMLLALGYPFAYAMARAPRRLQAMLVMLVVLPLYAALEKIEVSLHEAAADLGAPPWKAFWRITVPLSRPGIVAGSLLCFVPVVGEFVIPDLLGGSATLMIGQTLWTEFFANRDWPIASAVAVVLLCLLIVPILIYQHRQAREIEQGR